jgi:hypothetical protein
MPESIAFLLWLVFVGISAIIIGFFIKYYWGDTFKEGFTTPIIYACPTNSTNYITKEGYTNCCNGDVVNGECNGNDICTLSPNNVIGLPTCTILEARKAASAGAAKCPGGIPNYFASADGTLKGCSVSNITPDGVAPTDSTMLQCILYPTAVLDSSRLDSCQNYLANQSALAAAKASCVAAAKANSLATPAASPAAATPAATPAAAASPAAAAASSVASSVASLVAKATSSQNSK